VEIFLWNGNLFLLKTFINSGKKASTPVCLVVNQYFIVLISRIGKVKGRWPVSKVAIGLEDYIFSK